jgi:hypothetical protein
MKKYKDLEKIKKILEIQVIFEEDRLFRVFLSLITSSYFI